MINEYFKFCFAYELKVGDVFKRNNKGVFLTVLLKDESGLLVQTTYGTNLRSYQVDGDKLKEDVLLFPARERNILKR